MFASLALFRNFPCPDRDSCFRRNCLFGHQPGLPDPKPLILQVPVRVAPVAAPSTGQDTVIPAKRPAIFPAKSTTPSLEPPRKLQKVGPPQSFSAVPQPAQTESGVPILRIKPNLTLIPVHVRQTMLKSLYDHFAVLYENILPSNPTIAADHALKQEEEVYKKSTKATYRIAVIQSITLLKRRPVPNSASDPSVGTEEDIAARVEAQKQLESLRLSANALEYLIHSVEDLKKWGYFIEVPDGPGGDKPSLQGTIAKCDRCPQYYLVKDAKEAEQCVYHWGKPFMTKAGGEKVRTYTCCSRPVSEGGGCSHGPHVFYETDVTILHSRHAFSFLPFSDSSPKLDVAALDCEMIYTTGGMRVARVSVIDGSGKEIFDQFIKMDDGVDVVDYNTRFSGVTEENLATATMNLDGAREALNAMIDSNTILIGHSLDNDLKTLRIIHHRCIDTVILFPHKAGNPYRRSLRDLVREKLGKMIQTGGADGHSSVEDASAALDLVRWYTLNKQKSAILAVS